jgi:predicted  nucleic acid-binding Zn-ribbon protein
MSLETLKQLDEHIQAVIERAEQLRQDNARLNEQVAASQRQIEEVKAESERRLQEVTVQLQHVQNECRQHENERLEIKNRIEKLLARFEGLNLA